MKRVTNLAGGSDQRDIPISQSARRQAVVASDEAGVKRKGSEILETGLVGKLRSLAQLSNQAKVLQAARCRLGR